MSVEIIMDNLEEYFSNSFEEMKEIIELNPGLFDVNYRYKYLHNRKTIIITC